MWLFKGIILLLPNSFLFQKIPRLTHFLRASRSMVLKRNGEAKFPSPAPGLPRWLTWYRIRLQCGRPGFRPWVGKIPWRRERLPTPVVWPGEFHGQRSLKGYCPQGRKESDTPEQLSHGTNATWDTGHILR